MSDTSKFWLGINVLLFTTICIVFALSVSYWKDHNTKIANMVLEGVDPVSVMCAMQDDYGNHPVCLVLATQSD